MDPFSGQIRPVKRWDNEAQAYKMVIQTGIDGYRSSASRTDDMAGIEDATFNSEEEDHPKWAKVTVYRWSHGEKIPYSATARWSEYVQKKKDGTPNSMWAADAVSDARESAQRPSLCGRHFPMNFRVYTERGDGASGQHNRGPAAEQETKSPGTDCRRQEEGRATKRRLSCSPKEGVITARQTVKRMHLWLVLGENIVRCSGRQSRMHPFGVGDKLTFSAIEKQGKERSFGYCNRSRTTTRRHDSADA